MNKSLYKLANVGLAAAFAVGLSLSGIATTSAHTSHSTSKKSLPTLHLVNWIASNLALAGSLDPSQISEASDYFMVQATDGGLVEINPKGLIQKVLAKKISVSKNKKHYIITLRKAKFFNGDTITAPDVVFSVKRALRAPGTGVNYYDEQGYGDIAGSDDYANGKSNSLPGVKALNKTTVEFTTTDPIAYFLDALTYPINYVLDPAVVQGQNSGATGNFLTSNCPADRATASGQFTYQCVGNGFYNTSETPRYTLIPNPKYWGHKAKLDIQVGVAGTVDTEYNEYLSGALDASGIPSANLPSWKANPKGQLNGGKNAGPLCPHPTAGCPTTIIDYIQENGSAPPFNDLNCRLALDYGLNRQQILQIFNGAHVPLYTITPPGLGIMTPAALKTIAKKVPTYNASKAQSYAAKCPASNKSAPSTFIYASGSTAGTSEALAIQQEAQSLGFTGVQAKGVTQNDWDHDLTHPMSETGIGMIIGGWAQDYPDPQDYVSILFDCGSTYNIMGFCSTKGTKAAKAGDVQFNKKKRIQDYLNAQVADLQQALPIMMDVRVGFGLWKPYVHGLHYSLALSGFVPNNNDWSTVTIGKH